LDSFLDKKRINMKILYPILFCCGTGVSAFLTSSPSIFYSISPISSSPLVNSMDDYMRFLYPERNSSAIGHVNQTEETFGSHRSKGSGRQ